MMTCGVRIAQNWFINLTMSKYYQVEVVRKSKAEKLNVRHVEVELEAENDRLSSVYLQPLLWQTGEVLGISWRVRGTMKNVE